MRLHWMIAGLVLLTCGARAQELRAGYAKADITPTEPVYMGGYNLRNAPSDGVHGNDRIYVRVLVFEAGNARLAFVESDVIGTRQHDVWRQKVAAATGIPVSHILMGDTHNHAAPPPNPAGKTNWNRQFEKALLTAAGKANSSLEPVRIAAGAGRSRIGMNRRKVIPADTDSPLSFDENNSSQSFGKHKTDNPTPIREFGGVIRLGANPGGPIDEAVKVVRIDAASGKPLAVMIHYACHGTSLGGRNSKISGEWMGRMQEYVEKQFPGVGCIFVQGAAGDVNPRVVGGLDGNIDNVENTWALGEEIGREVARVYRTLTPEPARNWRMQLETTDVLLPRQYREVLQDFRNTSVRAPTTAVRLGDLMWTTFPGEMFHAIGKHVTAGMPATHAFLMGYTNGSIGYFPERKAYSEGGYEVAVTHLDPAAQPIYERAIAELMKRFR
jgi:neutral ceramidase